ncbi:MAG TPA: amidase [Acidimicrobiales bacterium]|nr:amidase [Acidimicrobiales bacterium]
MTTWIVRCTPGPGIRVAVKDLIDVRGLPTTAGCAAVAQGATEADADARCLTGLRAAVTEGRASIAGKANLHELALGITGINPWYGTPVNPVDPRRPPGGSSSGSAVAVGSGEADVAFGTDTGGSVRIPAACCGVVGLKTTFGRIPTEGVRPLAPSYDTVGPLARDVEGLVVAMQLLEPGFAEDSGFEPATVGRLLLPAAPAVDAALDAALAAAGSPVVPVSLPGWEDAARAGLCRLGAEAWASNGHLMAAGKLGDDVAARLSAGAGTSRADLDAASTQSARWCAELDAIFERVDVLALPTLLDAPPLLEDAGELAKIRATVPINVAGVPAVSLPVPAPTQTVPASLQLVGPKGSEERLVAFARRVEAAIRR